MLSKMDIRRASYETRGTSRNFIERSKSLEATIQEKIDMQQTVRNDEELSFHRYRFLVLFLSVMTNFGYYYCYDLPNALSDLIFDELTHESNTTILYNQLYSVISLPNVFLPMIGSVMIYKYGIHTSIITLNLIIILGQVIFAISGFVANSNSEDYNPFFIALTGRFIYGLGGEILNVCMIVVLCKYFNEKELSFSIGMYYSCTWLSACISNYITPYISNSTSLCFALSISTIVCLMSILAAVVLIYVDNHANKQLDKEIDEEDEAKEFHCKDVKELPMPFWIIAINSLFFYAGMLFYNVSNEYFTIRYGFNQIEAAKFGANSYLLFIFITPLFGLIVDSIGHRVTMIFYSSLLLAISELIFIMIPSSPSDNVSYLGYIPILLIGFACAVYYAGLYPTIPLIVKPYAQGTAFGINASFSNLGNSLSPLVVGALTFKNLKENTYFWVNVSLGILSLIGALLAVYLYLYDKYYLESILQKPALQYKSENTELIRNEIKSDSAL